MDNFVDKMGRKSVDDRTEEEKEEGDGVEGGGGGGGREENNDMGMKAADEEELLEEDMSGKEKGSIKRDDGEADVAEETMTDESSNNVEAV